MADVELLPLPSSLDAWFVQKMEAYARACVEANIAPLQAENERLRAERDASAQPVAWVAADTLNSPHPTCVSSLAYMSQLDRERGREYVPLYAAPQQPAALSARGSESSPSRG